MGGKRWSGSLTAAPSPLLPPPLQNSSQTLRSLLPLPTTLSSSMSTTPLGMRTATAFWTMILLLFPPPLLFLHTTRTSTFLPSSLFLPPSPLKTPLSSAVPSAAPARVSSLPSLTMINSLTLHLISPPLAITPPPPPPPSSAISPP